VSDKVQAPTALPPEKKTQLPIEYEAIWAPDQVWTTWERIFILKLPPIFVFEIFQNMLLSAFWDITSCSPFEVNRRFGGTRHLRARNQREKQVASRTPLQANILTPSSGLNSNPSKQSSSRTFYRTARRQVPEVNTLRLYIEFYFLEMSLGRRRTQK
jgi:hypothetical protein